MSEIVNYFGYGANRDGRAIAAITGRSIGSLVSYPAILRGYGMGIQTVDQIPAVLAKGSYLPEPAQDLVRSKQGDKFKSPVIFPKIGSVVLGTVWEITPDDHERIKDFQLVGDWYQEETGIVRHRSGEVEATFESMGPGQTFDQEVNGLRYPTWLQSAEDFEAVAIAVRAEYDARMQGNL